MANVSSSYYFYFIKIIGHYYYYYYKINNNIIIKKEKSCCLYCTHIIVVTVDDERQHADSVLLELRGKEESSLVAVNAEHDTGQELENPTLCGHVAHQYCDAFAVQ